MPKRAVDLLFRGMTVNTIRFKPYAVMDGRRELNCTPSPSMVEISQGLQSFGFTCISKTISIISRKIHVHVISFGGKKNTKSRFYK